MSKPKKVGLDEPSRLADLVRYIVESIVSDPGAVTITESVSDTGPTIQVRVSDGDVGRVIGRQGRTIRALRSVVGLARRTLGQSATLEIVED